MTFLFKYTGLIFLFKQEGKNVSEYSVLRNCWQKLCGIKKIMLPL